jgi:leucyl aminopeptidase
MKITLVKGSIDKAPKGYTRVRFLKEKGVKRLVRENGVDTLEISVSTPLKRRKLVTLFRTIIATAKAHKAKKIAVTFADNPEFWKGADPITPGRTSEIAAENFLMANFEFTKFKSKPADVAQVEEIQVYGPWTKEVEVGAKRGQIVGEEVNKARDLSNTPSSDMPPRKLAEAAKKAVKGLPVTVTVLTRAQMEKLGMGAVVGVGKGSAEAPVFIIMDYKGAASAPIVFAGKGVTFDSGGINIKPDGGHEMHMDMSGGAAVIHAVAAAARLKLKKHVVGLIPAVENMPGQHAYRIHDILHTLSGKTIEVMHTDAEGRVILADALTYAKKFKPSVVIDVATLTGAAVVALGTYASGLFTRDDKLAEQLTELGEESGDYVWRLPLWDEYESQVIGTVGDVVNSVNGAAGRYGGATNGAMFLWQFAKDLDCPWAHLDIAPRMTAAPGDELAKGAAGAPVRLLVRFIEQWKP